MNVAYLVSMFPCWSETFILNELVDHRRQGLDVSVFSLKRCSEKMVHQEALDFLSDTVYPSGWLGLISGHLGLLGRSPRSYLTCLVRLLRLPVRDRSVKLKALAVFALAPGFVGEARRRGIEHLHAHFATYPALLAWLVSRFTGIPFTFTAHAHDIYVNHDLLPVLAESCARIVTISQFNRRFLEERLAPGQGAKISVIHCGIPLTRLGYAERKAPGTDGPCRILSIGRLSGIKGFPYLVEALKLLRDDGVDFECEIVGEGPLRPALEQSLRQHGLGDRVRLVGSRSAEEIPGFLERADLFVLACATDPVEGHDGIPVVFMEAMARGVPVVGTRISGIPELVQHGITGYCAQSEDPVSLKEEIAHLLAAGPERLQLTRRARALVEAQFNISENSRELRELFARSTIAAGSASKAAAGR